MRTYNMKYQINTAFAIREYTEELGGTINDFYLVKEGYLLHVNTNDFIKKEPLSIIDNFDEEKIIPIWEAEFMRVYNNVINEFL